MARRRAVPHIPFALRHIGATGDHQDPVLAALGLHGLEDLAAAVVPTGLPVLPPPGRGEPSAAAGGLSEPEAIEALRALAALNKPHTEMIGRGYHPAFTPAVIARDVLGNPAWTTAYTPYQAEISQGRLEAQLLFQTLISDLTGLPVACASLLDEATAVAEAVLLMARASRRAAGRPVILDSGLHPQCIEVALARCEALGIRVLTAGSAAIEDGSAAPGEQLLGAVLAHTTTRGAIQDLAGAIAAIHERGGLAAVDADPLALTVLREPGAAGADVAVGSAQRLGVPLFYGGPHPGFMAVADALRRQVPGRIVGVSRDSEGHEACRLALQTREQHIRREKATSNICTAQALLAVVAALYAVHHGPEGLKTIAHHAHAQAARIAAGVRAAGLDIEHENFFDTLCVILPEEAGFADKLREIAEECRVNLFYAPCGTVALLSIDETTLPEDISVLCYIFASALGKESNFNDEVGEHTIHIDRKFVRTSPFLSYEVFNKYHTETEMMRYIKRLERKDISLTHSMISLGSCTMKLNAASEVIPLSNPAFCNVHPYAPAEQVQGSLELLENLKSLLATITGLPVVSLQPNSGAAGEYAGLRTIRSYHEAHGGGHRNKVLLPASAHGTNPASASQCGYQCVIVACDEHGNVDWEDFMKKTEEHKDELAAMMITYPSTHGIFETNIIDLCKRIHDCGALVYMDGANMNAQVGLTNPGFIGADVCHLNLHKTFAIPHGGGGPGSGPICMTDALAPYQPTHGYGVDYEPIQGNVVAASPLGSAGIDVVSYAYIRLLGAKGLERATRTAILNANYLAVRLKDTYGIVYTGATGRVGHELILDCRKLKEVYGVDESDIAKRLMDFGYHAPTLSFPVHGTLMIEPTESESKDELDRFLAVMQCIWAEMQEIKEGKADAEDNVLKNAPHPEYEVVSDSWSHSYPREKAAYPLEYLRENKFWINVARVDNGFGDRNLVPAFCACIAPSVEG